MPSFESFRKIALKTSLRKGRRGRESSPSALLIRCNTLALWRTTSTIQTNGNHYHFFTWIPILGHVLVHSVDKIHVLVGLLFLNIFSFSLALTPNKSLWFTRFSRNYVNHPAVVLTNHCQVALLFCLLCSV